MFGSGFSIWQQSVSALYPVGNYTTFNGVSSSRIIALNPNATIDTYFNSGSGADASIEACRVQEDRKILIGGSFLNYSGSARNRILRLNTDGTIDTTFNIGTGANGTVWALYQQDDDKVLAAGGFSSYSGSTINRLVRINENGTRDLTFATTFTGNIYGLTVQDDGKIIPVGDYSAVSGSTIRGISRLNSNGTRDTTFNVGVGASASSQLDGVVIQNDGKILVSGLFTSISGSAVSHLARLNPNGTVDTTLNQGAGFGSDLIDVNIQRDQKILACGYFTTYSGSTRNRVIRLNESGSIDTSFNIGTGLNNYATRIYVEPTGKIIVVGNFTTYSGSTQNRIVRINPDGTRDTTFTGSFSNALINALGIYPPK